jgi:hypothetical protein
MESMTRYCGRCGTERTVSTDSYCRACGAPYVAPQIPDPATFAISTTRRQRPLWLVIALSVATFGFYVFWWFGASWAEMKRELDDSKMHPFWHAVSLIVPLYCWGRIAAHFQTLNRLRQNRQISPAMAPFLAVVLGVIYYVASSASARLPLSSDLAGISGIAAMFAVATLIAGGQSSLNGYFQSFKREGCVFPARIRVGEWLTLVVGIGVWILIVIGSATS